jgi:hypothetical protein
MAPERSPTETSPLLGSSNGTVSNGTIPDNNVESGVSTQDEQVKEPFPDAQKQLKYIVPAISLGVSFRIPPRASSQ